MKAAKEAWSRRRWSWRKHARYARALVQNGQAGILTFTTSREAILHTFEHAGDGEADLQRYTLPLETVLEKLCYHRLLVTATRGGESYKHLS